MIYCSDQLDYKVMGKFLKGIAGSGCWGIFDELNRVDISVLSSFALQLKTIFEAKSRKATTFEFEGEEIRINPNLFVVSTFNPGYAGRSELPQKLKALFRPTTMMVPDYALISIINLYSNGIETAEKLGKKLVLVFKMCSEQLSSQDHYDFGMRAVKSCLSVAG